MEGQRLPPTSPSIAPHNKEKTDNPPSTSHRPTSSLPHIPLPTSQVSSPPPHFRQHSLNLFPALSSSPPPPDPPDSIPEIETYVVQVPRDQVYWTPPSENAKIVEKRVNNNGPRKKNKRCCSKRLMWFFISVVILGFIICAVALIIRIVYKPKSPIFHVKNVVKSRSYEVMLSSKNPTSNMWITYKGLVALTYKNKNIGEGNFPEISLPAMGFHTVDLKLDGSKDAVALPTKEVSLGLMMKLDAKYGTGLLKRRKHVAVTCDVKVKGLLDAKEVEIVSENCESKFTK